MNFIDIYKVIRWLVKAGLVSARQNGFSNYEKLWLVVWELIEFCQNHAESIVWSNKGVLNKVFWNNYPERSKATLKIRAQNLITIQK